MAMSLTPYVAFPGNAAEAMTYYQGIFGGELEILTFGHFNVPGMPAEGTMHSQLKNDHFFFSGADARPGEDATWGVSRVALALIGDDLDTAGVWFAALAEGGTIGQPLAPQMWGDIYGQVTDRYGVEWMFNIVSAD